MSLSRQLAEDLAGKALRYSSAEETEVSIAGVSYSLTRFANNTIHQNVAEEDLSLSVRAVADGRTARASTNKLDDDSIRKVCDSALALARLQAPDPDLMSLPGAQSYREINRFDGETAALSPRERAEAVREVIQRA